ncbi:MAG: chemotaxis protein CheA [Candidatus Methanogaster sp.]|uniref:Chemotaxis protein CheA n=1 Tax=Candidatus Methanogaster sp. TaxID=3386292 RepID=A0AC61L4U7_9EURY|nr:MAG: chemotaxis protein CheA [ANME-2 cluster archaeon]
MTGMDTSEYRNVFVEESREYLQTLNRSLLDMEHSPDPALLNEIFRAAHTLKGMSATMEFNTMAELCHVMEDVLDKLRNHELGVTSGIVDVLLNCFDVLEAMVDEIDRGGDAEIDTSSLLERLKRFKESKETGGGWETVESEADTMENIREINISISEDCQFKGARGFLVIRTLSGLGKIIRTIPDLQEIEDEKFGPELTVFIESVEDDDTLKGAVESVGDIAHVELTTSTKEEESIKEEAPGKTTVRSASSVRIGVERLDVVMNLVGELVINRSRLIRIGDKYQLRELTETLARVDRIITDLQDEITQMRMIPVDHIFNRFPRLVRDLGKTQKKEIDFIIEGSEIELDRTVLDEIGDPLLHLLRNAVDHGIESPDDRVSKGKDRTGTIKLIAERERGYVTIKVEDDGKGIDPEEVRNIAVKKGFISEERASELSDTDALLLIFNPGFSTAEVTTDVSGRGVGMDVVKSKVESLGGTVEIQSQIGTGSKTRLRLPITMAIIQALLADVGDMTYAIPLSGVLEILKINTADIKTLRGTEVINLRGKVLPLVTLRHLFGIAADVTTESRVVVVVEKSDGNIGLVIDSILDQEEIVIKPLGKLLEGNRGFSGTTILGDGRVIPILDTTTLAVD